MVLVLRPRVLVLVLVLVLTKKSYLHHWELSSLPPMTKYDKAFVLVNISDIIDRADEDLFNLILSNPNHVLAPLVPDKTEPHYNLRSRCYDRQ